MKKTELDLSNLEKSINTLKTCTADFKSVNKEKASELLNMTDDFVKECTFLYEQLNKAIGG